VQLVCLFDKGYRKRYRSGNSTVRWKIETLGLEYIQIDDGYQQLPIGTVIIGLRP